MLTGNDDEDARRPFDVSDSRLRLFARILDDANSTGMALLVRNWQKPGPSATPPSTLSDEQVVSLRRGSFGLPQHHGSTPPTPHHRERK